MWENWCGPICVFLYCNTLLAKLEVPEETLINIQKLSGNEMQNSIICITLQIIHLSGIFVVRKSRYIPICFLESFFAANHKITHTILNNCPNTVNKHGLKLTHWKWTKNESSYVCFVVREDKWPNCFCGFCFN